MFIYMSYVFSNVVETSLNSTKEATDPEIVLTFCSSEAFIIKSQPSLHCPQPSAVAACLVALSRWQQNASSLIVPIVP